MSSFRERGIVSSANLKDETIAVMSRIEDDVSSQIEKKKYRKAPLVSESKKLELKNFRYRNETDSPTILITFRIGNDDVSSRV